ncbi:hypothetical protein [uncultured Hoeflea sp.]|uniref:hypothetical protein n=1 Tax=uncultured Hoeflea sp. TaxID=538666 RepID=UPI0030EB4E4B
MTSRDPGQAVVSAQACCRNGRPIGLLRILIHYSLSILDFAGEPIVIQSAGLYSCRAGLEKRVSLEVRLQEKSIYFNIMPEHHVEMRNISFMLL